MNEQLKALREENAKLKREVEVLQEMTRHIEERELEVQRGISVRAAVAEARVQQLLEVLRVAERALSNPHPNHNYDLEMHEAQMLCCAMLEGRT